MGPFPDARVLLEKYGLRAKKSFGQNFLVSDRALRGIADAAVSSDMDWIVVVSVDDRDNPKLARVHLIPGDELRDRFNRAYSARLAAGHTISTGQPMFIS